MRIVLPILLSAAVFWSTATVADPAAPAVIEAAVDFNNPAEAALAYEELTARLGSEVGQVIELTLVLSPSAASPGDGQKYLLTDYDARGDAPPLLCGTAGSFGFIDNVARWYRLTLQHPENYHSAVEIIVGDRATFIGQSLVCLLTDYTSRELTPLQLKGRFWVDRAEIPTQEQYLLVPVR